VDVRDVRVIQRGEHLSLAAEAREAIGIVGHGGEEDLDRHVAIQPPIATAVDFAHPARAEDGHDLVWAEARTRSQRHGCQPCWILARMPRESSRLLVVIIGPCVDRFFWCSPRSAMLARRPEGCTVGEFPYRGRSEQPIRPKDGRASFVK
jgi:hypothetical protein